jgi:hypothetical protein
VLIKLKVAMLKTSTPSGVFSKVEFQGAPTNRAFPSGEKTTGET